MLNDWCMLPTAFELVNHPGCFLQRFSSKDFIAEIDRQLLKGNLSLDYSNKPANLPLLGIGV